MPSNKSQDTNFYTHTWKLNEDKKMLECENCDLTKSFEYREMQEIIPFLKCKSSK